MKMEEGKQETGGKKQEARSKKQEQMTSD